MRAGIVGCGVVSTQHLRHLCRMKGIEVVGVCDIDEVQARRVAAQYGISSVYTDLSRMIDERRAESIHVLTPPQTHRDLSIQAMAGGCHVLVEKPMAVNAAEAQEMIAASHAYGVSLGVCHNLRFQPVVLKAKEWVDQERIGKLVSVGVDYTHDVGSFIATRWKRWLCDLPGLVFHELSPHVVYLLLEFFPALEVVSAVTKSRDDHGEAPSGELRVFFDGGNGLASMCLSMGARPSRCSMLIHGTEMTLQLDLGANTMICTRTEVTSRISKVWSNLDYTRQLLSQTVTSIVQSVQGTIVPTHRTLISGFYESIRTRTEPPVTGDDGKRVVAILDQIWKRREQL